MNLVVGCGCWVEVRSLVTSELKAASFAPVLDALYSLGKPFRFVVVDVCDEGMSERCLVRFYFQFVDEQTRVQMSNIIKGLLDVEVVAADLSVQSYRFSVDLELAKNYALPIIAGASGQEKSLVNLIDQIVASIAGLDVCLEVIVKPDPNAVLGIQKFVYEKSSRNSGLSKSVFDPVVDLVDEFVGKTPNELPKEKGVQHKVDPWTGECLKNAQRKLASNLFICKIIIKSNNLQDVHAVKNALPSSAMNHFKTFKTNKKTQHQTPTLKAPSHYILRNNVLCNLWWIMPVSIVLFTGVLGVFNPLRLISTGFSANLWIIVLSITIAFCSFTLFRKRQPIVLSTQELSQIIGLPTAVEKLPVALGKVPISRMQLGYEQTEQHQKTSQINQPNNYRLHPVFEDGEIA